jgi:hypothetical protein
MRDDQGQRIFILTRMDELDLTPSISGREHRKRVQPRLDLAPVVVRLPVARELLKFCEWYALRGVADRFLVGPTRLGNAMLQIGQSRVRDVNMKRMDCRVVRSHNRRP